MPKASAPKAPWVEVWESPQTMVRPGRVNPNSGPMTWTMPWRSSTQAEQGDTEFIAVLLQRLHLGPGDGILDVQAVFGGGHIVVHGGEGQVGPAKFSSGQAQALEGLRAGDLVHQVAIDVEQAVPSPVPAPRGRPDFFEECFSHGLCSFGGSNDATARPRPPVLWAIYAGGGFNKMTSWPVSKSRQCDEGGLPFSINRLLMAYHSAFQH
jgi:hypothetical protein